MRYVLFLLTSLPIFLAGLGWGWRFAALAGFASIAIVALIGGPLVALIYGVTQILPAVALTYLALLSAPISPTAPKPS